MYANGDYSFVVPFDFLQVNIYFKGAKSYTKYYLFLLSFFPLREFVGTANSK